MTHIKQFFIIYIKHKLMLKYVENIKHTLNQVILTFCCENFKILKFSVKTTKIFTIEKWQG